jgi:hypothetical protein
MRVGRQIGFRMRVGGHGSSSHDLHFLYVDSLILIISSSTTPAKRAEWRSRAGPSKQPSKS